LGKGGGRIEKPSGVTCAAADVTDEMADVTFRNANPNGWMCFSFEY
jgi:hypothetical protein